MCCAIHTDRQRETQQQQYNNTQRDKERKNKKNLDKTHNMCYNTTIKRTKEMHTMSYNDLMNYEQDMRTMEQAAPTEEEMDAMYAWAVENGLA